MARAIVKVRRDTKLDWDLKNPVLADGEPGLEKDTGKLKIGDGITPWSSLDFYKPIDPFGGNATLEDHVESDHPHPVYDDGPSFELLYQNAKV